MWKERRREEKEGPHGSDDRPPDSNIKKLNESLPPEFGTRMRHTWEDALDAAEDRDGWRKRIARCAVQHGMD